MLQSPVFELTITGSYYSLQLPEEIVRPFLDKGQKRVRVVATYQDKKVEFHGAIQKRKGLYVMIFGKHHQKKLGIFPNDYFQLQFFEDTTKYGVAMSEEFEAVLFSDPEAHELFETLTDGRKRGLIYAIGRYKNSQTRIDKSIALCENLKRGIRDPRHLLQSF